MGVASFILAVLCGIAEFCLIVIAGVLETSAPGGLDVESPAAIMIGLCVLAGAAVGLLGLGLAIAALVQPDRKRVFAVLGLAFNTMIVLGVFGMTLLGMSMQ